MKPIAPRLEARLRECIDPAIGRCLSGLAGPSSRCLEIGCGPGQYRLSVGGEYVGVDITAADYGEGLPRTPDALADAGRLPFGPETFTLVFFSNIFHFLPDPDRTLAEALRVLRPGGTMAIFDYSRVTVERLARGYATYDPPLAARAWNCGRWVQLFQDAGLDDVKIWRKTPMLPAWTVPIVSLPLVGHVYRSLVDGREGGIVLVGRKAA